MKRIYLLLILMIFLLSGCFKVNRYVGIRCYECNTDLGDLSDCANLLEKEKSNPEVIKFADKTGVDLNEISKTVKQVTYPGTIITCQFYGS